MQNTLELIQSLSNTTLKASDGKDLEIQIKIIEEDQQKIEKVDLQDGLDWYQYGDKFYRKENGKYFEYDENGNEFEVNFGKERKIQFIIEYKEFSKYIGYLNERQIMNTTNHKIDVFDFFLALEEDVNYNLFKEQRTSIMTFTLQETPNPLYQIEIIFSYKQVSQTVQQIFCVCCTQVQIPPAELLMKTNEKWFKECQYLQNQIIQITDNVNKLEKQVIEQEKLIAILME